MNRRLFYFSLLSLSITGCSTVSTKHALGDLEYAKKSEAKPFVTAKGLDKPNIQKDFFITNKINYDGPIGEKMDIRSPSLVLPVAASSRTIAESSDAIIWFDKVLEDKELLAFIEKALVDQFASDGVDYDILKTGEAVIIDNNGNKPSKTSVYESNWYHNEVESGWLFTEIESATSLRFQYQLLAKPHGRSVSLKVSLIGYMKTDNTGGSKDIDPIDKQRAEMAMINEVVSQVDYNYRVQNRENRLMRANQKLVTIGENPQAEHAYVVEMGLDDLWDNMPIFFEKHGFVISDLNETKKIYHVDFVKPDSSIWDSIWGDEVPVIEVSDSHYQFALVPLDDANEKTSVTIYNADGEPLTLETLNRIFPVVEMGLSFRNIY
ncbi:MAG: outer membrane protein assembly factor BamC [Colwellia sp.]